MGDEEVIDMVGCRPFHASREMAVLSDFGVSRAGQEGLLKAQNEEWIWVTFSVMSVLISLVRFTGSIVLCLFGVLGRR
jgi:hypothetical protein